MDCCTENYCTENYCTGDCCTGNYCGVGSTYLTTRLAARL